MKRIILSILHALHLKKKNPNLKIYIHSQHRTSFEKHQSNEKVNYKNIS
jgi:hypothetical protein